MMPHPMRINLWAAVTTKMIKVTLNESNAPVHLDVEEYIRKKGSGQVTFTIRMNNGSVVDFNRTDYVDTKAKYFGLGPVAEFQFSIKRAAEKEPAVPHYNGNGDPRNAIRDDNI